MMSTDKHSESGGSTDKHGGSHTIPKYRKFQSILKNFITNVPDMINNISNNLSNAIFSDDDVYLQNLCDIELKEASTQSQSPEIIEVHSYHSGLIIKSDKEKIVLADGEIFNLIKPSAELLEQLCPGKYVCIKYQIRTKNILNIYPMKKSSKYDMKITTWDNLMKEHDIDDNAALRIYVNRGNICKIEILHDKRQYSL